MGRLTIAVFAAAAFARPAMAAGIVESLVGSGANAAEFYAEATAAAAVLAALCAVSAAWYARRRAKAIKRELSNLRRAIDEGLIRAQTQHEEMTAALARLSEAAKKTVAEAKPRASARSAVNRRTAAEAAAPGAAREVPAPRPVQERPSHVVPAPTPVQEAPAQDNVVALPASRTMRPVRPEPQPASAAQVRSALALMVEAGDMSLSLQPIISLASGGPAGFDVFAHVPLFNGDIVDVRRIEDGGGELGAAEFERAMVEAAVDAARRQLGSTSEKTPLHVAISRALLGDEAGVTALAEMYAMHPSLARSLVLSLPGDLLTSGDGPEAATVARLFRSGARFCAEGLPAAGTDRLDTACTIFLKLPAAELLRTGGKEDAAGLSRSAVEKLRAAGIEPIAAGVDDDEVAMALLDSGLDLMSGARFSGPQRLRKAVAGQDRAALT